MEKEKIKYKSFFSHLKKTYSYASKREKIYLFLFLLNALFMCGVNIIVPVISAKQIVYLTDSMWKELIFITLILFTSEMTRNFLMYIGNKLIGLYYLGVKSKLQIKLASETLKIKTEVMNENSSSMFSERMGQDVNSMTDIFISLIHYVTSFITGVGVLIAVLFLNKIIFVLYVVFVIALCFTEYYRAEKLEEIRKENRKISEEVSGFSTELVRGSKDIKLLNAEESFISRTRKEVEKLNKSDFDQSIASAKFRLVNGSLWDLLDLFIMAVGVLFLINNRISISSMLVIFNYRWQIITISYDIQDLIESIKKYTVSSERVFDIIDGVKFKKERFGKTHLNKLKGHIEFKNVYFNYKNGDDVLKDISFKINPNETVSFVGKSGSGKSTIFNLISKLYTSKKGEVLLDGININKLDKDVVRGNISVISQNPYIFNMSIKDNLKVVKEDASDDEIISACKMAALHDYIVSLKDGYDTIVGESGVTLSGGQRQRLAIARALIQNTEIILFDEATSALDNETQGKIQDAINNMQGIYTILIIAHRLSTVINADKIFLIDDGKVSAVGTHAELLEKSEIYKKLYNLELKK